MPRKLFEQGMSTSVSRRTLLRGGAGLIGGTMLSGGMTRPAMAVGQAPIGTWPAGSQGDTVIIGAAVPRTGTYAVQGEDELKGMQLAVEHINEGNELIKKIAPKVDQGRARQAGEAGGRRLRPPSRTTRCRSSSASSTRTRSSP